MFERILFSLFIASILCGAIATQLQDAPTCAEPKADPNRITLRFMRHGWSCAQCCRDIGLKLQIPSVTSVKCQAKLLLYKDPLLTTPGVAELKARSADFAKCLPNPEWTLMSSPMTRTIETALNAFPTSNVLVVPFMKECAAGGDLCLALANLDKLPEDRLSDTPDIQYKRLGALASRVSYYKDDTANAVVQPRGRSVGWSPNAFTTNQLRFFAFLSKYAKATNKRKFVLVTHSGVMTNLLLKLTGVQILTERIKNGEMWETTLDINGRFIPGTTKRVFQPIAQNGDCSSLNSAAFAQTTSRCDW